MEKDIEDLKKRLDILEIKLNRLDKSLTWIFIIIGSILGFIFVKLF